jgi:hypothetical protein
VTIVRKIVVGIMLWVITAAGAATAADFNAWQKMMPITFTGYNPPGGVTTLTNFPALVVLSTNISGFSYSDFLSLTNQDLRFTASNQTTELNYEIEKWDTNGSSYVWVQVPHLVDTNTSVWAYWGKSGTNVPAYVTNGMTWYDGFSGVWHLSETNGVVLDSGTNHYSATISGAGVVRGATGQVGNAYSFSGSSSSITLAMTNGNTVTIAAWGRNTLNPPTQDMLWCRTIGAPYGDLFFYSGKISLNTGDNADNPFCNIPATVTQMHQYVTVLSSNASGTRAELFIDGRSAGTAAYRSLAGGPFRISSGQAYDWHGVIDEVQISNVARSSNWVWAAYMNHASNGVFANSFNTYGTVQQVDPDRPKISNAGVSDVTPTSATFSGNLDQLGATMPSVLLFWGITDGGTNASAWAHTNDLGVISSLGPVSTNLAGLTSDRVHYFRFCATNSSGDGWANSSASFVPGTVWVEATSPTASYGSRG